MPSLCFRLQAINGDFHVSAQRARNFRDEFKITDFEDFLFNDQISVVPGVFLMSVY